MSFRDHLDVEGDAIFQNDPATIDGVLDGVDARHGFSSGNPVLDTYRRPTNAPTPTWRMEPHELERITAPIAWAHLEGVTGVEADEASRRYTELRDLRDRLDDADDRFQTAASTAATAPQRAADAAREAIEAGLPVPTVYVFDLATAQATIQSEYVALASMILQAAAHYRNAASKVAPAARTMLAARLPEVIVEAQTSWRQFADANDERVGIVTILAELNRLADPLYRDLLPHEADRKIGGSLVVPGEQSRAQRREAAGEAIATLTGVLGSNDPLVTGSYVADELHAGGAWPIWYRRALLADGDVEQLGRITREDATPVHLDGIPTPSERYRATLATEPTSSTKRTRLRG